MKSNDRATLEVVESFSHLRDKLDSEGVSGIAIIARCGVISIEFSQLCPLLALKHLNLDNCGRVYAFIG